MLAQIKNFFVKLRYFLISYLTLPGRIIALENEIVVLKGKVSDLQEMEREFQVVESKLDLVLESRGNS